MPEQEAASEALLIGELNDSARRLGFLDPDSGETFADIVNDRLRIMNIGGVHTPDEAFIDLMIEDVNENGLGVGTIIIVGRWDLLHSSDTLSELCKRLKFSLSL